MESPPTTSRAQRCRLTPVMMTPSVSPVESVAPVIPEPRPVIAIGRSNDDANHWSRSVEDRARRRWRRVIVSRRGCSVRFNHLSPRVRTHCRGKAECEDRQCCHNKFLPHDLVIPPVVCPIEPNNHCEVARHAVASTESRMAIH